MVDNIEEPNEQIEEQDNFADDSQDPPIEDATRYIVKVSVATHTLFWGSGLKGGFYIGALYGAFIQGFCTRLYIGALYKGFYIRSLYKVLYGFFLRVLYKGFV